MVEAAAISTGMDRPPNFTLSFNLLASAAVAISESIVLLSQLAGQLKQ